jgi:hypothetical protein
MTVIGALSSFREIGEMSPHKRACVHRTIGWPETSIWEVMKRGRKGLLGSRRTGSHVRS